LRVSRSEDGPFVVEDSRRRPGHAFGRSAYVCRLEDHVLGLFERGRIERALRLSLAPEEKSALREALLCKLR
jgi:predicted RNA-binding protein YlxR (DUF448 family)